MAETGDDRTGPGHYATLGVHQAASTRIIMEAYDALEAKTKKELTYDEPTAAQKEARAVRLGELRIAAMILRDPRSRRLYDRELSGEKINWAAEDEIARKKYRDPDAANYDEPRRNNSFGLYSRGGIDRSRRTASIYPDTWIARVDGRSWKAPKARSSSPFKPSRIHRGTQMKIKRSFGKKLSRKQKAWFRPRGRPSPTYSPYSLPVKTTC